MIKLFCKHNWDLCSFEGYYNLKRTRQELKEYWLCECARCGKKKIKKFRSKDIVWDTKERRYVLKDWQLRFY